MADAKHHNIKELTEAFSTLLDKASEHKLFGTLFTITVIAVIAETIFPESAGPIIAGIFSNIGALAKNAKDFSAEKWEEIKSESRRITDGIVEYVRENRVMWIMYSVFYILLTTILLFAGWQQENNWAFAIGASMVIIPILLVGKAQSTIGNVLAKKEDKELNKWQRSGKTKNSMALILFLVAMEFMIFHTILFMIIFVAYMAVMFIAAGVSKRSPDPWDSVARLAYVFCGISFVGLLYFIIYSNYVPVQNFTDSVINKYRSTNALAVAERNDQTDVTSDIASETEKSPWRVTKVSVNAYYVAYNGADVEAGAIMANIPASKPVRVIKDEKITDKIGVIWVHVQYGGSDGWIQNRWLETLSNEDATRLVAMNQN